MRVIYHPETETVEVPVAFLKDLDRRLALLQVLVQVARLLNLLIWLEWHQVRSFYVVDVGQNMLK
ncbi:hypothetical protein ES703_65022 [subsurface metagenome]